MKRGWRATEQVERDAQKAAKLYRQGKTLNQIAEAMNVSARSVCRYLNRLPDLERVGPNGRAVSRAKHGTYAKYQRGCRCAACRRANRERVRQLIGRTPPRHGKSGYQNYRCRCPICKAAGSEANREYVERRRQRAG